MQLCEEVTDGLAALGHQIAVLTSTYCRGAEPQRSYPVHRLLTVDPDWNSWRPAAWQFYIGRQRRERQAVENLRDLVNDFSPDVIFVWHAIGLPRVLLQTAEQLAPTVYYLAGYLPELPDEYIAYWEADPSTLAARLFKRPLAELALASLRGEGKPISLKYEHVICVSDYVRQRLVQPGLISRDSIVIYNGVDLEVFSSSRPSQPLIDTGPIACLIAGRVVPDKGVHTAIDAFVSLNGQSDRFRLTILGGGPTDYIDMLKAKVQSSDLQDVVNFQPSVPRSELPQILAQYDVLLLPSEYAEPIARSMQEGMAMGLLVIGTTTGGSGELLVHDETGFVFQAGDPVSLSVQLQRVAADPAFAQAVARRGQEVVRTSFTIQQTIDKVEAYLEALIARQAMPEGAAGA